ncbi:cold shock domain-containing protein [Hymenobacter sp. HMF4947]|uniref:Cold shock domain-containing protein n=1 Tax=Hymenobacter ginkgonis TaxID=2682976 RepID=A0A7K1TCH8_9BACT|nr:cold shock domain-containing protein [Hymenobacter ginkgonis]MVN76085.1 cold shock domain-containing protein [Hymenobacter ginkgonis]
MARAQETFSKKENEKKRLKKKTEKEEKKKERQANATQGQSLEDMLAYVDENGNITSTPPDPTRKRKEIALEDIQVGVPKQEDREPEDLVRTGTVSFFNDSKGYGFIKDQTSQESIFVHANALNGLTLKEGNKVTFEVEMGMKGPTAVRVKMSA